MLASENANKDQTLHQPIHGPDELNASPHSLLWAAFACEWPRHFRIAPTADRDPAGLPSGLSLERLVGSMPDSSNAQGPGSNFAAISTCEVVGQSSKLRPAKTKFSSGAAHSAVSSAALRERLSSELQGGSHTAIGENGEVEASDQTIQPIRFEADNKAKTLTVMGTETGVQGEGYYKCSWNNDKDPNANRPWCHSCTAVLDT
ncbi:uncharacterized protein PGTG_03300 [Puccinia graminis f. sp. tritici CRL 75-36-700-3]|uniref:Uncharacterized protein n=1 Tax=Puccinia graminis f. sp. tritici (strain CRL 75-36-700-3 / race SCCL) TaxID=418459 RepID=E3JZ69_PUCGT|nr:uncharacterized protein PGTG_03300 [Puccinia graminis f. sp. tritici CRL 75-36-700-3]EFP77344.1 hypothetical protein PGTG_03300 [Puccinia graminis f. sp. tritici CRL 75-36-700-3]